MFKLDLGAKDKSEAKEEKAPTPRTGENSIIICRSHDLDRFTFCGHPVSMFVLDVIHEDKSEYKTYKNRGMSIVKGPTGNKRKVFGLCLSTLFCP